VRENSNYRLEHGRCYMFVLLLREASKLVATGASRREARKNNNERERSVESYSGCCSSVEDVEKINSNLHHPVYCTIVSLLY